MSKRSNITRKDLARSVNEKLGFSQKDSEDVVNEFFSSLKNALMSGESAKLVHFGTLGVRKKTARRGRNPRTGEAMEITKRSMVTFKPSKGLREKVNR